MRDWDDLEKLRQRRIDQDRWLHMSDITVAMLATIGLLCAMDVICIVAVLT